MKSFKDWMEAKVDHHKRTGLLKDWIEKFKDNISVKQGYGTCEDCVHIMYRALPGLSDVNSVDMWGLYHLEDYVVTSHVSGPAVVLMPLDEEGLVRKVEHLDEKDPHYGDVFAKFNKLAKSVNKRLDKKITCHRCGQQAMEKTERDEHGQWYVCKNCGTRVYGDS